MKNWSKEFVATAGLLVAILVFGWNAVRDIRAEIQTVRAEVADVRASLSADIQRVETKVDQLTGYVHGLHGQELAARDDR